jgi:hypothetical protein
MAASYYIRETDPDRYVYSTSAMLTPSGTGHYLGGVVSQKPPHMRLYINISSEANHRCVLTQFDMVTRHKTPWLNLFQMSFDTNLKASNEAYVCFNTQPFMKLIYNKAFLPKHKPAPDLHDPLFTFKLIHIG